MQIVTDTESSLQVVERVDECRPTLVIVSHLPPEGSTLARYLVKRLRVQFADLPIVVGLWGEADPPAAPSRGWRGSASRIVFTLADARARILNMVSPDQKRNSSAMGLSA